MMILSFSYVSTFLNCPKKAYHTYIARDLPQKKTPEQLAGTEVHEAFENRLVSKLPLPSEFKHMEGLCKALEGQRFHCELKLAMTASGRGKGFWEKDAWARGAADCVVLSHDNRVLLLDWKNGKEREDPLELDTQAMLLRANNDELKDFMGHYVWLRSGKVGKQHKLDPDRAHNTFKRVDEATLALTQSGRWPAKPNPLCGWCVVGSCEHNRNADVKKEHDPKPRSLDYAGTK